MLYSRLSILKQILNENQYSNFINYLSSLSINSKITISQIKNCSLIEDVETIEKALKILVDEEILNYRFAIHCPECGLLLPAKYNIYDIEKEETCYNCNETFEIDADEIEVVYNFKNYPFECGQQNDYKTNVDDMSVAPNIDKLTYYLQNNKIDLNKAFFSPTDDDYELLDRLYKNIFSKQKNTKTTGDTLENLTIKLFSLCKHLKAAPVRLKPNQIDCFVRNTLFIPGVSNTDCKDSFTIECKNESKAPKSGYMNKLHSILELSGGRFGIIVSKHPAPNTFVTLSNKIYLLNGLLIISIDKNDLHKIIYDKQNLLECIERKIAQIKLDSTTDLIENGLFDA